MRGLIEQEVDDEAAYAAFDHVEKHAKELFNNIPDINPDLGKVCIQIFKDQIPRILKAVDDRDGREAVEGPGVCDVIFGLHYIYTVAAHFIAHLGVENLPTMAALDKMATEFEQEKQLN